MSWFNQNLQEQIEAIIHSMENNALKIPDNWRWGKGEPLQIHNLEEEDVVLMTALTKLHRKGEDVPELTLQMMIKARNLRTYIKAISERKSQDSLVQHQDLIRLRKFTVELDKLFEQEKAAIAKNKQQGLFVGKGSSVRQRCLAYFMSLADKAESSGEPLKGFIKKMEDPLKLHPFKLYNYLIQRDSGCVDAAEYKKEYVAGPKQHIKNKLQDEIYEVEQKANQIEGVDLSQSGGWNHCSINKGNLYERGIKAYITIDYTTFNHQAFLQALAALSRSGFKGQIKIIEHDMVWRMLNGEDNVVIHGDFNDVVVRAAQLVTRILKENGVIMGESSHGTDFSIAQDFKTPKLRELNAASMKTSFNDAVAHMAVEMVLLAVHKYSPNSYDQLRKILTRLFEKKGYFEAYVKKTIKSQ